MLRLPSKGSIVNSLTQIADVPQILLFPDKMSFDNQCENVFFRLAAHIL